MAKQVTENPVTEEVWGELSPLSRSMIEHILQGDTVWFKDFVEGTVLFKIGNRQVHKMTPAPDLRLGHGLSRSDSA